MRNDLRQARIDKGLTQAQLGDLIGKSQAVVSRYEAGDSPVDVPTAPLLSEAIGLSILQILYPVGDSELDTHEAAA